MLSVGNGGELGGGGEGGCLSGDGWVGAIGSGSEGGG